MKKLKANNFYRIFYSEGYYIFNGSLVYDYLGQRFISAYNIVAKRYIAK